MALSTPATSPPTSPQLRLSFNSRNRRCPVLVPRPTPIVMCRLVPSRTVKTSCTVSDSSSAAADHFAGWSESDGNGGSKTGSNKNQFFGGIVGASAAGVIVFAGITFAALSISRSSDRSRVKQEMQPLTAQQESALVLDIEDDRVEEVKGMGSDVKLDDSVVDNEAGIDMGVILLPKAKNELAEDKIDEDENLLKPTGGIDNNLDDNSSVKEDLQCGFPLDNGLVVSEMASVAVSFPQSSSENEQILVIAESLGELSAAEVNNDTAEKANISDFIENEDSNSSLKSSFSVPEDLTGVVPVSSPFTSLVDTTLAPESGTSNVFETLPSNSNEENIDTNEESQSSNESNSSFPDNLDGNVSSETTFVSLNEQDSIGDIQKKTTETVPSSPTLQGSFSSVGIPAPSALSAPIQVKPGKVLVPAVVDQIQGQALAALQVLKVIETDVQASDLCTRREYARWLVAASNALSRSSVSKVYPAMYIGDVTELAFDDVTPDDPDFPYIQGLAEAGLISSKLSRHDLDDSSSEDQGSLFFPESPLPRQDLVSWKMALEKRQLPVADEKILFSLSGFRDIDKINPDAWPALVADLSAGDQGIISLAFGCTRLFQPGKPVTKAQAAIALATGEASDLVGEELARIEAEAMAEKAVSAHNELIAQVEKDINASFEKELLIEKEKTGAVGKLAEEARQEVERLRAQREEDSIALAKERATIEAEMEVLSRLRREVEEQLENLLTNKAEISFEKERINSLQKEAEKEKEEISRLQYELEVERKALLMARTWAEDEAKRAREHAKALEEARYRWQSQGIKVVVDNELQEDSSAGVTWLTAGNQQFGVEETVARADTLLGKLKLMAENVKGKARETIHMLMVKIKHLISTLKERFLKATKCAKEVKDTTMLKANASIESLQQHAVEFTNIAREKGRSSVQELQRSSADIGSAVREGVKRVAGDCRDGVGKLTQRFKS